ncbi:uncharacterized protein LOC116178981 isoform X2 [Photinus pyralis]|uniref:uncharacterized protein LOC116178981 isoform X2 n=1 Tax=Photinus pyralis TaxID=7054 RepID=UPI0012671BF5|nr:uncharacterized protein LOC116178981 isoform X2 [Photinus pyralis]
MDVSCLTAFLFFLNVVTGKVITDNDKTKLNVDDITCCNENNIDLTVFIDWFDERFLLPEHDPLVNKFAKCWMNKRGYVSSDGVMNEGLYREWIRATVFGGIDLATLKETEVRIKTKLINDIIPSCKDRVKCSGDDCIIIFYNCVANKVYNIMHL